MIWVSLRPNSLSNLMEHRIQESLAEIHTLTDHLLEERLDRHNLAELLGSGSRPSR